MILNPALFLQNIEAQTQIEPYSYRGSNYIDVDYGNNTHTFITGLPVYLETDSIDPITKKPVYISHELDDNQNHVTYSTGSISWTFYKDSCTFRLFEGGKVTSETNPVIENISVTMQEFKNSVWENTPHNDLNCNVTINELPNDTIQLIAQQGNSTIGYKEIELIQEAGRNLETFYRSPIAQTDNVTFGFVESHVKNQDMEFTDADSNLHKFKLPLQAEKRFSKESFIKDLGNKLVDIPIITKNNNGKISYNLKDSIHGYFTESVIREYETSKLQAFYNFHDTPALNTNERLEVDPVYSSDDPNVDGWVTTSSDTGTACPPVSSKNTAETLLRMILGRADINGTCIRSFIESDISPIPVSADVIDTKLKFETVFAPNPRNCDFTELDTQPSGASASTIWNDIGDGTVFLSDDPTCKTVGTNKSVDLGTDADSYIQSQLPQGWAGIGVKFNDETRVSGSGNDFNVQLASENDGGATPKPTLEVTYTVDFGDPQDLSCSGEPYSYDCSWTAIDASVVTGYHIAHSSDNSTWSSANVTTIGNVTSTTYTGFGITESNYIRVNATHNGSNSSSTNVVFATTDDLPDSPLIDSEPASKTQIDITRTQGASDGGDTITHFDLRCELNNMGGWNNEVINGTITNSYSKTGLSEKDILTCQWRDRNGVGYSDWSDNSTSTTFTNTVATVSTVSEVVGNSVLLNATITINDASPAPVTVSQLEILFNGSSGFIDSTVSESMAVSESKLFGNILYAPIPDNQTYNATAKAIISNSTGTITFESSGEIVTRDYEPDLVNQYTALDDSTLGGRNYTIDNSDPANRVLKVNRPIDSGLWDISCYTVTGLNNQSLQEFSANDVGHFKKILEANAGDTLYGTCVNPPDRLFTFVSYGNLTGVLAGFSGFDDTLGSWFGLPMVFMFVFFLAGLFGGRQSGTGLVIFLAGVAVLGAIGLLVIDEAIWGIIITMGAFGLLASRIKF